MCDWSAVTWEAVGGRGSVGCGLAQVAVVNIPGPVAVIIRGNRSQECESLTGNIWRTVKERGNVLLHQTKSPSGVVFLSLLAPLTPVTTVTIALGGLM